MKAMATQRHEKPLIGLFLGKLVSVEVERGVEVTGRLLRYELGNKNKPHRPHILIMDNGSQRVILRGNWLAMKSERALNG